ncbi:MAG: hypothetical protein ABIA56_02400 [Actinomycetota bacterium]
MTKIIAIVIVVLLTIIIIISIFLIQFGITPQDTKIIKILELNKDKILGIEGVVGAGININKDNNIVGIVIYIEDDIQETEKIPSKLYDKNLGEYKVFIKKIGEASDFEKEKMIIHK